MEAEPYADVLGWEPPTLDQRVIPLRTNPHSSETTPTNSCSEQTLPQILGVNGGYIAWLRGKRSDHVRQRYNFFMSAARTRATCHAIFEGRECNAVM